MTHRFPPRVRARRVLTTAATALALGCVVAGCSHPSTTDGTASRSPLARPAASSSPGSSAGGTASTSPPPPVPSGAEQSGNPGQPPVVWIGGTLTELDLDRVVVQEAFGAMVTLQQLGRGATAFFEISGGDWETVGNPTTISTGQPVCVETLLDGDTLLALRVFLGATCGPA